MRGFGGGDWDVVFQGFESAVAAELCASVVGPGGGGEDLEDDAGLVRAAAGSSGAKWGGQAITPSG